MTEVCRKMGVSEATFFRWKQRYGVCGWPPVLQEESWQSSSGSRLQSCVRPSARHDGRWP
ncbi:transposase [Roseomonas sp. SSH11]|uniref:Transposase n=1 Tax=Pararoseomonas baculiformis TaxID=2820812 RepID=A0ABS4ALL9_9PROT|nr:transposase [Pararoseomonas baculiformis]